MWILMPKGPQRHGMGRFPICDILHLMLAGIGALRNFGTISLPLTLNPASIQPQLLSPPLSLQSRLPSGGCIQLFTAVFFAGAIARARLCPASISVLLLHQPVSAVRMDMPTFQCSYAMFQTCLFVC